MTDFVETLGFALHIAMVGQKQDFDKMNKQSLTMVLYRSHRLKTLSQLYISEIVNLVFTQPITFNNIQGSSEYILFKRGLILYTPSNFFTTDNREL